MLAEARVGTTGFAYREWIGHVYPPEAASEQLLPLYAERLSGVEIATLTAELAESWAAAVPPSFQFAVKAPGRIATELASGKSAARTMGAFLDIASRLGDALGPVLIQVPASRPVDRHALGSFLASLQACASPSNSSIAPGTTMRPCGCSPPTRPRWYSPTTANACRASI